MPSFDKLFSESKERPVLYNGLRIWRVDVLGVNRRQGLKVVFDCANSNWRQGIRLDIDDRFEINGQTIRKAIVLWQDTAPKECRFVAHSKKGEVLVRNVWDTGDGVVDSWHNGAAMIVEEFPNGKRYKCNDGLADDDFDDLIFSIELISG